MTNVVSFRGRQGGEPAGEPLELADGRTVTILRIDRSRPAELGVEAHDADGEVVGMAICELEGPKRAAGTNVTVDPSWRRAGLGHALLAELLRHASELGVAYLVSAHPEGNVAAAKLLAGLDATIARRVSGGMVKVAIKVPASESRAAVEARAVAS